MKSPFDQNLRIRVQRMLRGEYLEADFNELFLALRQRPRSERLVREVGHFIAHRETRDNGIVTDILRDFCTVSKFHYGLIKAGKNFDFGRLPALTPTILRININELEQPWIKKKCGLKRTPAKRIVDSILAKMSTNSDGTHAISGFLGQQETALLICLLDSLQVRAAFNDEELLKDFLRTLGQNTLLEDGEKKAAQSLRAPLALFVLTRLHQANIVLHDGTLAFLRASGAGGVLQVNGNTLWEDTGNGKIMGSTSMFSTSLSVADYCEGALASCDDQTEWSNPIELTSAGKIREISL